MIFFDNRDNCMQITAVLRRSNCNIMRYKWISLRVSAYWGLKQ